MALFAAFKDFLMAAVADIGNLLKQVRDQKTLDMVTAMAVLVSRADGQISKDEVDKLTLICERNMPHFSRDAVRQSFSANMAKSDDKLMAQLAGAETKIADLLIRAGVAIGGSDGDFDEKEKAVVRKVADALWLDPRAYAL